MATSQFRDSVAKLLATTKCISAGGLETTLVFDDGMALPCFASFPLLDKPEGRERLLKYFREYCDVAKAHGVSIVLDTNTWRANSKWGAELGYDAAALDRINKDSVDLLLQLREEYQTDKTRVFISGTAGPRGDAYKAEDLMTVEEAKAFHLPQMQTFARTAADLVSIATLTYAEEAVGAALAAAEVNMPLCISFTVETDGKLPSGGSLADAIAACDNACDSLGNNKRPIGYSINCAHPTHFDKVLMSAVAAKEPWIGRLSSLRANASCKSHAELNECTELDRGDPQDIAARYRTLLADMPHITVLGGCCGTDVHLAKAIAEVCLG